MSWKTDDPRLTAYALGELQGAAKAEVESAMAAQPELRQAVDEIWDAQALLSEAFRQEEKFGLTVPQRARALNLSSNRKLPLRTFWLTVGTLAAGIGSVVVYTKTHQAPPVEESLAITEVYLADNESTPAAAPAPKAKRMQRVSGIAPEAESTTQGFSMSQDSGAHGWSWTLEGPKEAEDIVRSLEARLKRCKGGEVSLQIDPQAQSVTILEDGGHTAAAACWVQILAAKKWPGDQPYTLSLRNL